MIIALRTDADEPGKAASTCWSWIKEGPGAVQTDYGLRDGEPIIVLRLAAIVDYHGPGRMATLTAIILDLIASATPELSFCAQVACAKDCFFSLKSR